MDRQIGDRIKFHLGVWKNRPYESAITGVITEILDVGRYTVKAGSGFCYSVNESGIVKCEKESVNPEQFAIDMSDHWGDL